MVVTSMGVALAGPQVAWKGRRRGRRQARRWARAWSPEQIAQRLPLDFPDDPTMRISHEAIYQARYVQGRGALRRELSACLRTGRALRLPRARVAGRGEAFVTPDVLFVPLRWRNTRSFASTPACRSTSVTPIVRGSAVPTRTATASCDSTSPRARIWGRRPSRTCTRSRSP